MAYLSTKSLTDHAIHLTHVLDILRQNKLFVKFSKCELWLDRLTFLGHIVTGEDISVDPSKIEAILSWDQLTIVSKVLSFLGLSSYYHHFVKGFSKIASPLTRLTRKEISF